MSGYRLLLTDEQAEAVEPHLAEWGRVDWEGRRRVLIVWDATEALIVLEGVESDPVLAYLRRRVDRPLLPISEIPGQVLL